MQINYLQRLTRKLRLGLFFDHAASVFVLTFHEQFQIAIVLHKAGCGVTASNSICPVRAVLEIREMSG